MNKFLQVLSIVLFSYISIIAQITTSITPDLDGKTKNGVLLNESSLSIPYNINSFTLFNNFPVKGNYVVFSPKTGSIACNLDSDPDLEILFGSGQYLYAINPDSTSVPGWPKSYAVNWEAQWAPSFGDIDGDNQGEVVVGVGGALGGKIYAYEKNGTDVPGFPITTGKYPMTPSLADIDNNGTMEIITGDRNYRAYVYKGDGTVYPGWPKMMDRYVGASASIGDLENNGSMEIFMESRSKLWGFDKDGNVLPGFPFTLVDTVNGSNSYSAPVLADIDNNGVKEIIFCAHDAGGVVYVLKKDGTLYPGFPKNTSNWIYAAPSVYDVDKDGFLDIIVAEYGSSTEPAFYIYCYKKDGTQVAGFPLGPFYGMANQVAVANLDADADMEIMFDQNIQFGENGCYYGYNFDGTVVSGFPLSILKNTSFQQPVFGDLNGDMVLDVVGTSFNFADPKDSYIYPFSTGLSFDSSKIPLPVYQYNLGHTGVYKPYVNVPVELNSFTGVFDNSKIILSWETSSELNNSHFLIYRNDLLVANITGNGTSTEKHKYSFEDKGFIEGTNYYKLEQVDYNGASKLIGQVNVTGNSTPYSFTLEQNYPNPFNPETMIKFALPLKESVVLTITNSLGEVVKEINEGVLDAGQHYTNFNAAGLPSGIYFYSIQTNSFSQTKKMVIMK